MQKSTFLSEALREYHLWLAIADEDDQPEMLGDFTHKLEKDRSKEAVDILFEIANWPDPRGMDSFGIGGLARIGKGAIPQIISLMGSQEPLRALTMLEEIMDLSRFVDVMPENVVDFLKILISHPEWPDTIQDLERQCQKRNVPKDLRDSTKQWISHLQAASGFQKSKKFRPPRKRT